MSRKVCLITGSGSGNGHGMAIRFAELGYDICLHHSGRDPESAEKTRGIVLSKGVDCKILVEDLYESGAAQRLFEKFSAEYDRLDLFINNSGKTVWGSLMDASEEKFQVACNVNWRACYFCIAEAGKFMKEKGIKGSIVTIASNHWKVNFGHFAAYGSMKAAMVRFVQYAALEFSKYGIRVNCIAPGYINAGDDAYPNFKFEEYEKQVTPEIPLHRFVTSSELADIAEFLASPVAASITGNTLTVDGGAHLCNFNLEHYRL